MLGQIFLVGVQCSALVRCLQFYILSRYVYRGLLGEVCEDNYGLNYSLGDLMTSRPSTRGLFWSCFIVISLFHILVLVVISASHFRILEVPFPSLCAGFRPDAGATRPRGGRFS